MIDNKYDIFVSYANEDRSYVKELVKALRKLGVRVWYDEGELRIGDSMLRQIEEALENSRFFVLVISENYLSEAEQWTFFETGVAITRDMSSGGGRILPITLGEANLSTLPTTIKGISGMDANEKSIEEIASDLAEVVKNSKERV